jgi:copper homeostasis protein (lipoprotein)
MARSRRTFASLLLFALAGILVPAQALAQTSPNEVVGTVAYLQRSALPPDAVVIVRLEDVSLPDAPAKLIAETKIETAGKQVPIPFRIAYSPADVVPSHRYGARASILSGGELRFTSAYTFLVLAQGAGNTVDILVQPVRSPVEQSAAPSALAAGITTPATFQGVIPCADCEGIQVTLTLFPGILYLERLVYQGRSAVPVFDYGRWSSEQNGAMLALYNSEAAPARYAVKDADTIRQLDSDNKEIASNLSFDLKRMSQVEDLKGPFSLTGLFTYVADGGTFHDCRTHLTFPVAREKDNAALEVAYSGARSRPGAPAAVELQGHFEQRPKRESSVDQTVVVVDTFTRALPPGLGCPSPKTTSTDASALPAPIEGRQWDLIEVEGTPIAGDQGSANLTLSAKGSRLSGSSGCNRLIGSYELNGDALHFRPASMTMMACPEPLMKQERALTEALEATNTYSLTGQILELRNGDRVLARFSSKAP